MSRLPSWSSRVRKIKKYSADVFLVEGMRVKIELFTGTQVPGIILCVRPKRLHLNSPYPYLVKYHDPSGNITWTWFYQWAVVDASNGLDRVLREL